MSKNPNSPVPVSASRPETSPVKEAPEEATIGTDLIRRRVISDDFLGPEYATEFIIEDNRACTSVYHPTDGHPALISWNGMGNVSDTAFVAKFVAALSRALDLANKLNFEAGSSLPTPQGDGSEAQTGGS